MPYYLVPNKMLKKFLAQLAKEHEIIIKIKIRPNASVTRVRDIMADQTIKLDLAASPEKGKANSEIIKFLAKIFDTEKENVKILRGRHLKQKLIKIVKQSF